MFSYSLALTGSGGAGVVTLGHIILELAAQSGLYGLMRKSYGPQIRGGESAALIRLSDQPIACPDDQFDLLLALDWNNADRFADEIPLSSLAEVIVESKAGNAPPFVTQKIVSHDFQKIARQHKSRANMVALGLLVKKLGLDQNHAQELLKDKFSSKSAEISQAAIAAFLASTEINCTASLLPQQMTKQSKWLINGNAAAGFGALKGGIRFVAAYPITPASDLLEWIAPRIEQLGGSLLQAEDELASINALIGGSWGGTPSLTATSGPGLSLMIEGFGLAVASETPLVVVNVQRGGPSTGIPTKSEQTDLNIALHAPHGEAPHLVLAPLDVADCLFTTQWSTHLAETLQTPAIVLSDQYLGQTEFVIPQPTPRHFDTQRKTECDSSVPYQRYALTEDNISPFSVPGETSCSFTADGLEHEPGGKPSSSASDHLAQMQKRQNKLSMYNYGDDWGRIYPEDNTADTSIALITWGSSYGACQEAVDRLQKSGISVKLIAPRLLAPFPVEQFKQNLSGIDMIFVAEQSFSGQFYHELLAQGAIDNNSHLLASPGPIPLTPGEVVLFIEEQLNND